MEIRAANIQDVGQILENRLKFLQEIKGEPVPDQVRENTRQYLKEHLADDTWIACLALDGESIVSSAILSMYEVLPTLSNPGGRTGYLFNVYTLPAYRRKGLSQAVLGKLIREARARGLGKIYLDYTADGKSLYEKLGFEHLSSEMALKL
ncbi:GNAT family N-acetyltransferase ['Paenibacillus yunnanensis' Narsing Rao et al. 2020]|uniref:GNAT family N-acetyltransferase n=1 Tax=Paenibacillus tengchongensis TaxID=2608684 RepID=UPI00124E0DA6|nr:GNAT family N-acetyltransferase [Paenibacillus tengchongensis]